MELFAAIEFNDLSEVQRLLKGGADLQQRAANGHTPLMCAAGLGHTEILDLLLQNGADPETSDGETARPNLKSFVHFAGKEALGDEALGHTALFCAARRGHAPMIQRLLQSGANPNRCDFLNQTPLHWAAEAGHQAALQALLEGGAQPDAAALMAALENNHPECAQQLLEAGVSPDQKALVQAATLADARVLKTMLTLKPRLKAGKALAYLGYATRTVPAAEAPPGRWTTIFNEKGIFKRVPEPEEKILEALEILLQAGASVNEVSSVGTALSVAAQQGLTRVVERLLEAGADPYGLDQASSPPPKPTPAKTPKILKQPSFKTMPDLGPLEKLCGALSTRPEYLRGGHEIQLKKPIDLLSLQRQFLKQGVYLFHPSSEESLAVIPAEHWRVAIALMQTNGANCDIHPADVLKWLETLEKTQPFELTTIAHDRLEGIFLTPIADPKGLAKKMYRFCPDIVDQGCGTVKVLAEELRKEPPRLYFWWD